MAEQQVGRLHVAVHEPRIVDTGECRGRGRADCPDLGLGQATSLGKDVRKRARRPGQHELSVFANAMKGHDARALNGVQAASFECGALKRGRFLGVADVELVHTEYYISIIEKPLIREAPEYLRFEDGTGGGSR